MWVVWVFTVPVVTNRRRRCREASGRAPNSPAPRSRDSSGRSSARNESRARARRTPDRRPQARQVARGARRAPARSAEAHAYRFCFARPPHQHEEQRQQPQAAHHVQHEIAGTEQGRTPACPLRCRQTPLPEQALPHAERQQRRRSQLLRALGDDGGTAEHLEEERAALQSAPPTGTAAVPNTMMATSPTAVNVTVMRYTTSTEIDARRAVRGTSIMVAMLAHTTMPPKNRLSTPAYERPISTDAMRLPDERGRDQHADGAPRKHARLPPAGHQTRRASRLPRPPHPRGTPPTTAHGA